MHCDDWLSSLIEASLAQFINNNIIIIVFCSFFIQQTATATALRFPSSMEAKD